MPEISLGENKNSRNHLIGFLFSFLLIHLGNHRQFPKYNIPLTFFFELELEEYIFLRKQLQNFKNVLSQTASGMMKLLKQT